MSVRAALFTLSIDSESAQSDPSEDFAIYLQQQGAQHMDASFQCIKYPGIFKMDQNEGYWENILSMNECVIIIASASSGESFQKSLDRFLKYLESKIWNQGRFVLVTLGEIESFDQMAYNWTINFPLNGWGMADGEIWARFWKLIKGSVDVPVANNIHIEPLRPITDVEEDSDNKGYEELNRENIMNDDSGINKDDESRDGRVTADDGNAQVRPASSNIREENNYFTKGKLTCKDFLKENSTKDTFKPLRHQSKGERPLCKKNYEHKRCERKERNTLTKETPVSTENSNILQSCFNMSSIVLKPSVACVLSVFLFILEILQLSSHRAIYAYNICVSPITCLLRSLYRITNCLRTTSKTIANCIASPIHWVLGFIQKRREIKGKPSGLKNTKETCYMNAMVQAMAASSELAKEFKTLMAENGGSKKLGKLMNVFKSINEPGDEVSGLDIATNTLISFMNSVNWNRSSQQDTFQLLSFFINAIQNDLKVKCKIMPLKLKILHAFTENPDYNKVQDHLGLSIPLCGSFRESSGVSINILLDAFFETSVIDEGPHSTQLYLFQDAPKVLILHIQANEWSDSEGAYVKPEYHIKYEKVLKYTFDIKKDKKILQTNNVSVYYELVAVVRHMGDVSGGHYVTYRKCGQQWYLANDEQVEAMSFNCEVVPYVLVYDKITK